MIHLFVLYRYFIGFRQFVYVINVYSQSLTLMNSQLTLYVNMLRT